MNDDEKQTYERLYFRERNRREALWKLEQLRPGDPAAEQPLATIDAVEADEQEKPIGTAIELGIEQLRERVPVVDVRTFRIVRDEDIPEPWRERFSQASTGSTRIPEGCYSRDWLHFLHLWPKEMAHLQRHREERKND